MDGAITGVKFKRLLSFARPMAAVYDSFRNRDARWTAGLHVFALYNLDGWECREEQAPPGSKKPIGITNEPEWYLRAGLYRDLSIGDRETLSAELGLDYAPATGYFGGGLQFQVLVTDDGDADAEVHLGGGLKIQVLDVFGIVPFVQHDVRGNYGTSIGAFVIIDLLVFKDLGLNRQVIGDAIKSR